METTNTFHPETNGKVMAFKKFKKYECTFDYIKHISRKPSDKNIIKWANGKTGYMYFSEYGMKCYFVDKDGNETLVCEWFFSYFVCNYFNSSDKDKIRKDYYNLMIDSIRITYSDHIYFGEDIKKDIFEIYLSMELEKTKFAYNHFFEYLSDNENKWLLGQYLRYRFEYLNTDKKSTEDVSRIELYKRLKVTEIYKKGLCSAEKTTISKNKKCFITFDNGVPIWNGTNQQLLLFAIRLATYNKKNVSDYKYKDFKISLFSEIFDRPHINDYKRYDDSGNLIEDKGVRRILENANLTKV